MKTFPLRLSTEEHEALKTVAAVTGRSANDIVRTALRDYLAGPGRREEFEALLDRTRERHAVALDKLADL
jgi:predicted DNA-binding protein